MIPKKLSISESTSQKKNTIRTKILLKVLDHILRRWKDIPCSLIGINNIVKVIHKFYVIPIKISAILSQKNEQKVLEQYRTTKGLLKQPLGKKGDKQSSHVTWHQTLFKATVLKTIWYCTKINTWTTGTESQFVWK